MEAIAIATAVCKLVAAVITAVVAVRSYRKKS